MTRIHFKKLEQLNSSRIKKTIAFNMAEAANKLHLALDRDIKATFTIPRGESLTKSRLNKSTSTVKTGKNFIKSGLEYRNKPVTLDKYPIEAIKVPRISKYRDKDSFRVHTKTYAWQIKAKQFKSSKVAYRNGQPVFKPIVNSGTTNKEIFVRDQNATWTNKQDVRAPFSLVFGMSMAQMVEFIIRNPQLRPTLDKAELRARFLIVKSLNDLSL